MLDSKDKELRDYKFFCFDGKPTYMFIATNRMSQEETKFDFFDMDYNHLPFTNGHPNAEKLPEKPSHFELMKKLAEKLSVGIPHVRVDFYEADNKVYFGEYTFYHWGGLMKFEPEEWDYEFGRHIVLPTRGGVRRRIVLLLLKERILSIMTTFAWKLSHLENFPEVVI